MKKKILLISYYFSPNNVIGAIRPTKIAERLSETGHHVDVFTYGYTNNDGYTTGQPAYTRYCMDDSEKLQKKNPNSWIFKRQSSIIQQLKKHIWTYNAHQKYRRFLKHFIHLYDTQLCKNNYDAVFTTFGPICSLQAGLYVKKKNPHINWICDFRDPAVGEWCPLLYKPLYFYYQEKACKLADHIITVSDGYCRRICRGRYGDKAHMIPNGYDEKDKTGYEHHTLQDGKLHFTYVGALYLGERDIGPVFKAIKELIEEGAVKKENIVFDYAGTEYPVLLSQANQYSMGDIIINHNRLPRKECLALQFSSHLLVLSTWNNKGEEGVFPGKFLEYMLIEKPIVALVNGKLQNSEVKQVMTQGNLGVTYEAATEEEDFHALKEYIKMQYDSVTSTGNVKFSPNQSILNRYNYDNIIQRIEDILA